MLSPAAAAPQGLWSAACVAGMSQLGRLGQLCRAHTAASRLPGAVGAPPAPVMAGPKGATPRGEPGAQEAATPLEAVGGMLDSLLQQSQAGAPLALQQRHRQHEPPGGFAAADGFAAGAGAAAGCVPSAYTAQDQSFSGQVRMESQLIFDGCWRRFKEARGMDFAAPREVVWLNGAPGSGKGVSTPHIMRARGMGRSVCMSSLLSSAPEARRFIEAGEMIADAVVGDLLLDAALPRASGGASAADRNLVVDGFPRTAVQVDFVQLLMEKLRHLHTRYIDTPFAARFPRPSFKVVVLYVDEQTSVRRQLQRAVAAQAHNQRVIDAGVGERQLQEERSTDLRLDKALHRYQVFKQHYSAILRLKQSFSFHLIDAMGSPSDTVDQVAQELRYQSSLDLSEEAYTAIRQANLPLAKELQTTARQQLVGRLDGYCQQQRPLFGRVLGLLQQEVLPLLQQGALAGAAEWVPQGAAAELFTQHPRCVDMLLDVLSDRGFTAHYVKEFILVPVAFDAAAGGAITTRPAPLHRFRLSWSDAGGARGASALKALEIAARIAEGVRGGAGALGGAGAAGAAPAGGVVGPAAAAPITESFIPEHLDLEAKMRARDNTERLRRVALARGCDGGACGGGDGRPPCGGAAAGDGDDEAFVIHRCLRPDIGCGHAQELEVVSASG